MNYLHINQKQSAKAVFLDRDGVINVDHGYVYLPDRFKFIDGVFEACKLLQEQGYKLMVITNQSGIARGYYSLEQFMDLTKWMCHQFTANGVQIQGVYHCPHHPTTGIAPYVLDCKCRKPAPGMLFQAIAEHGIDPAQSIMVGDKCSDMQAASAAGVGYKVLVQSGHPLSQYDTEKADAVWPSLYAFAFAKYSKQI